MTLPSINLYGDQLTPTGASGHGADISSQREDDLDRLALQLSKRLVSVNLARSPVVYDIGCGYGAMSIKLAEIGCTVVACDIEPMPALRSFAAKTGKILAEHIVEADARYLDWAAFPPPDIVYSQRFLHYLRFSEALALIRGTTSRGIGCEAYLSMSGLRSELGTDYPDAPLKSRFSYLSADMIEKHDIAQKVCLYGLEDARCLAKESGLAIVQLWLSDFGNVKLLAKR